MIAVGATLPLPSSVCSRVSCLDAPRPLPMLAPRNLISPLRRLRFVFFVEPGATRRVPARCLYESFCQHSGSAPGAVPGGNRPPVLPASRFPCVHGRLVCKCGRLFSENGGRLRTGGL